MDSVRVSPSSLPVSKDGVGIDLSELNSIMKVHKVVPMNIKNRLENIRYRTVADDRFVTTMARETRTTNKNPCHKE